MGQARPHLHHVRLDAAHKVRVGLSEDGHERVQGVLELGADRGLLAAPLALQTHPSTDATTSWSLRSLAQ